MFNCYEIESVENIKSIL